MTIRPWRRGDDVQSALGPPQTWLEAQGREQVGAPAATTVVAEDDGRIVGVGCTYLTRWHPQRMWCYVEVATDHRRAGHGTALLRALRERADRPLRGKVIAGSPGSAFAAARGFGSIQRCRTLAIVSPPISMTNIAVDVDPPPSTAARAFRAFYATTHQWDPLGEIEPDDFVASHIADAVASFVVRDSNGTSRAVGCLYDEGEALLFSGGPTLPGETDATRAVVGAAMGCAARAERPFTAEVDDANEALVLALDGCNLTLLDETYIVADG